MGKEFKKAMEDRRSVYAISAESTISDEQIVGIVENSVQYVPSAFHGQSARVAVLFGENHKKLWSIAMETLRKLVPAESFAATEAKINSFAAGYGTVLYFDDTAVTDGLAAQFELYKDNFPVWAQQANGMLQFAVWSQLEAEGLGASLQHYNPLIDDEVKQAFGIPASWKLIAQMPFGKPTAAPDEKQFVPISERVKILK
ncbi:nitroreductase family protein [Hydrogenoanaerobacterium sp.]|uniref:nitroreductase family protein n=1 Tax=Hydrogenoanaerobacterium sp. TaxID=2953763 RepID=UPI0028A1127E|nr:nitroreductase family protein [Hydrogenoanaerobacterium sp.]